MSRSYKANILQERNLPLVIQFARTSPTFNRHERIEALEGLVARCLRAIDTCLAAFEMAWSNIEIGAQHLASLEAIRADLPPDEHCGLTQMAGKVHADNREELDAIRRNLEALRACKQDAEQGCEL